MLGIPAKKNLQTGKDPIGLCLFATGTYAHGHLQANKGLGYLVG